MDPKALLSIYRFNRRSNESVFAVAARLTEEDYTRDFSPSNGSIRGIVAHMIGGEVYYLALCQGRTPDADQIEALPTLAELRAAWECRSAEGIAFLESLSEADMVRDVVMNFDPYVFRLPLWKVFIMSFAHSHTHRGELSILLTQLGHPLPTVDMMVYFIKESSQPWPFD